MKKLLLLLSVVLFAATTVVAQQKPYAVAFYNLENLFDIYDDPETHDEEFTPEGVKQWNEIKYQKKLSNLERVLFDISAIQREYPIVIGVSEIENRSVLEDLVMQPKLRGANYRICHFDSPDARGVDCAFLYRADVFKLEGADNIKLVVEELPDFRTRDLVVMWGTIDDEPFYFLVSHWPSRLGGKEASAFKREACAKQIREIKDSVLRENPATKVIVMGDFNDYPTNKSMKRLCSDGRLRNLMKGKKDGTYRYRGEWGILDQFLVSGSLLKRRGSIRTSAKDAQILRHDFLLEEDEKYGGYKPFRTYNGMKYLGGFSDHLPIVLDLRLVIRDDKGYYSE